MWVIKPLKFPFQEFPFQDMYMIMPTGNFFVIVDEKLKKLGFMDWKLDSVLYLASVLHEMVNLTKKLKSGV